MIKFFRKIRYDLMEKNKTGKYLKYAIGEIVLVVIGILIALSINNWNDYRKDRIEEKNLYKTLIRSLNNDLIDVRDKSVILDSAISAQRIFITNNSFESISSKYPFSEIRDLINRVGQTSKSFVPNISIYNKIMQNNQIDLIQSDALQMQIMALYDRAYWEYKDLDASLENQYLAGINRNFFGNISHRVIMNNWTALREDESRENYDALKKDCREIYFLSLSVKRSMFNCEQEIEVLLESLNNELKL
ncbi:DUF6090 family protein [Bacteroidota bacterium]